MSRAERRRQARKGGTSAPPTTPKQPYWILAVCIGAALLGVGLYAEWTDIGPHPQPRADAHAAQVVPAERYASYNRAEDAYTKAAAIPEVLDGLYCYCLCSQHSGHYSLLDCFLGDHGAACDICMNEAALAYSMVQQGASLEEIRGEIDQLYGA